MPLFGHKNKNQQGNSGTNPTNVNDPAYNSQREHAIDRNVDGQSRTDNFNNASNNADFHHPNNSVSATHQGLGSHSASGDPATGLGAGAGTGVGNETHHGHGLGHQNAGAAGGVTVGSAALREQAMLREREAQNFQAQSKELAEAERLEQQAREHRERAVAQGAHPMNKQHLAGGASALGDQHVAFDQSRDRNL